MRTEPWTEADSNAPTIPPPALDDAGYWLSQCQQIANDQDTALAILLAADFASDEVGE